MIETNLKFSTEQLEKLFPLFITMNDKLQITSMGKAYKQFCEIEIQSSFNEFFIIINPVIDNPTFNDLENIEGTVISLKYKNDENFKMDGQFIKLQDKKSRLLFIGTPKFTNNLLLEDENTSFIKRFFSSPYFNNSLESISNLSEKNRLQSKIDQQTHTLKGINLFAKNMLNLVTIDEIAWAIVDHAISQFNLEDCVIYLVDENKDLIQRAAYGNKRLEHREILNPIKIKFGSGIVGKVASTGKPLIINDTSKVPDYIVDDQRRYSELTVPIIADNNVIGIIDSEHSLKHFFNDHHLTSFETIANLSAIKIKNALIQERQNLLEKAREIERKNYELIVENASEFIYKINGDGYITYLNNIFTKKIGYTLSDLKNMHFSTMIEESLRDEITQFYINKVLEHAVECYNELPIINKWGNVIWIGQSVNFHYDKTGSLIDANVVARDISKRIESQNLLKNSELRSNLIMNASLNAIVTISSDGAITFWNKKAEEIFGWKKNEVLGVTLTDTIIPKRYKKGHEKGMKHFLKTGEGPALNQQLELSAMHKKGHEFPIEISIVPIDEDGEFFFCSFIQDISERKKAELIRISQEEKYQNIISNMNLGLLEVDNDGFIQYANQNFSDISGFENTSLLNINLSENINFGKKIYENQMRSKRNDSYISEVYTIAVQNKLGKERWWAISEAQKYDQNKQADGFIGIYLDVTNQKQLELDLEKQKVKAEMASKAKESFLANMSHEIRTPLNGVIGMIRELTKTPLTQKQMNYLTSANKASNHLLSVVNNILEITKIEAGELAIYNNHFDFYKLMNDVSSIFEVGLKNKSIDFVLKIDEEVPRVFIGDEQRISQVLINIVGNAIKFSDQNGKINIKCSMVNRSKNEFCGNYLDNCTDQCTSPEGDSTHSRLKIVVRDTGIGMDEEFTNHLFEKFNQEDITISRKFGGSGLGLYITKKLLDTMSGNIKVNSQKHRGTEMIICLPIPIGDPSKIKKEKEYSFNLATIQLRILLVEDNLLNREVAKNALNEFDFTIEEVENGLEAVNRIKNEKFDLILMDIQMPVMNGIEATQIIRNDLKVNTPIIGLSANAFKSEIEKCIKVGMNDYITKPFEVKELLQKIYKYSNINEKGIQKMKKEPLYSLDKFKRMSKGDKDFVEKMLVIFVETFSGHLIQFSDFLKNKNTNGLKKLAHQIKPTIDIFDIHSIKEDIRKIENYSEADHTYEELSANTNNLIRVLKAVISDVKNTIDH